MPWWAWLTLFVGAASLLPVVESSGYVRRVAFDTVLYMLLALGLNVVVGWGGLLDLGYVAFFGIGAYAYAILDSDKFGIHLPTLVAVPSSSRHRRRRRPPASGCRRDASRGLPRDRHAVLPAAVRDADDERRPVRLRRTTSPAGANGILRVDPFSFFGHELPSSTRASSPSRTSTSRSRFFVVVFVALRFVNHSRTGRAWRSLREDPLAAEVMGMPVNWLKLLSFAFGAAVAALTGTLSRR